MYITEEIQYDFNKSMKKDKELIKLYDYSRVLFRDYGELPIREELEMIIKHIDESKIKVPREVKEQLNLLIDIMVKYNLQGTFGYDLHDSNFAYDNKKRIILMDTIFSRKAVALKLSNDVKLPDIKK